MRQVLLTNMLTNIGWNPLSDRHNEQRLLSCTKIIHHLVDIDANDLLPPRPNTYSTRGHAERFLLVTTINKS